MSSTFTTSNRFETQGTGDNPSTWGARLNTNTVALIDDAMDGVLVLDITVTPTVTLTTVNGGADQARKRVLLITGTATSNITITVPALNKFYAVRCDYTGSYTATINTSSTAGVVFKQGDAGIIEVRSSGVSIIMQQSKYLAAANNLSELTDKVAARANLGLGNPTVNKFTNDGSTVSRTLTQAPGSENAMMVFFDSVLQEGGVDFTLSGTTLTYTSAPANGTKEIIFIGNASLPAGEASDASITVAKLSSSIYATQSQAEAGTENTKLMTPLRVSQAIAALNPSKPGTGLSQSAGQSTASSVETLFLFDTEDWDDLNWHSTSSNTERITVNADGVYLITGYVDFGTMANMNCYLKMNKNGSVLRVKRDTVGWASGTNQTLDMSFETKLLAGDYISMSGLQAGGSTTTSNAKLTVRKMS